MTILVTGGSSLIGGAVARTLAARGEDVCAVQRSAPDLGQGVRVEQSDIADADAVHDVMKGCEAVVHLAAKVGVVGDRADYERINVAGTANVLAAARDRGVSRIVHVSSPSVAHDGTAIIGGGADEAIVDHGTAWYPLTKAQAERNALEANSESMAVTVLRPHLVWGPGDTQLVGRIVERARSGRLALVAGGRALVDTTYIDNAVDALVAALDAVQPGATCAGKAYVVANGEPRPIRELVAGICAAAGVEFAPREVSLVAARRVGSIIERTWRSSTEPPLTRFLADQLGTAHWFDPRPLRDDIGWRPTVSIDEGLRRLADWFSRSEDPRR